MASSEDGMNTPNQALQIMQLRAQLEERDHTIAAGNRHVFDLNDRLRTRDNYIDDLKGQLLSVTGDYNRERGRYDEAAEERDHWARAYKTLVEAVSNLRAAAKIVVNSLSFAQTHGVSERKAQDHMKVAISTLEGEVEAYDKRAS